MDFYFISLIPPFNSSNLKPFLYKTQQTSKTIAKNSYILLTWFYYLNFLTKTSNNKFNLKFFIFPIKSNHFTLTKAPMAHKNWSKEQYKFQYYRFKISFKSFLSENFELHTLNSALLFVFLTKKNFNNFETNLFFLKHTVLNINTHDNQFFNYNSFKLL